jgi:hypothetical protein
MASAALQLAGAAVLRGYVQSQRPPVSSCLCPAASRSQRPLVLCTFVQSGLIGWPSCTDRVAALLRLVVRPLAVLLSGQPVQAETIPSVNVDAILPDGLHKTGN